MRESACCVPAAAMSCPAQPVVENAFSLDVLSPRLPTLIYPPEYNFDCPPPFDPWLLRCRGPADVALTIGDLNNDGVPDLVVSNELALLWVYFLRRDPVTGDLSVETTIPIDVHSLTFTDLPAAHFGWGYYTVNVQVVVQGAQQYVSDWWPRLRVHP